MKPLANRIRPVILEDVFGQEHLLGSGKILNRIISSGNITNMIFYGPPGTGKTTVANIAAQVSNRTLYKLNATNASVKDIKEIVDELDTLMTQNGVILYLDEIQNFNKKQQQSLLEFIENGKITLIASTTDNPYFYIYKAILSRSTVFEFKPLGKESIYKGLVRAIEIENKDRSTAIEYDKKAIEYIAEVSGGDLRKGINSLELAINSRNKTENIYLDINSAYECTQIKIMNYDRDGDSHYDTLSAFQKSIRGSDPDGAIHYLGRLIKSGDLISIVRRLLVIAAEDIGLAYPNAISIVKSCTDSALQLGFPEARIPLAEAVILLATAPKSNSANIAIDKALADIDSKDIGDIPNYLKDGHYSGAEKLNRGVEYKYPHNYENNYVLQQYLPDNIKNASYYAPGKNKMEQGVHEYLKRIGAVK
ncbi:MAG: MgsA ATPase-like [Clostridiales bacterium]|nr:MgsA ATPase-like [Clostridiales bacterium]